MQSYILEISSWLRRVDAGVKRIYDRSVANDREGAWNGVQELGPVAAVAHEAVEGLVDDFAERGMGSRQVAALRAISEGSRQWSQLDIEMRVAMDQLGVSQEWVDLFDQRLYDVYVNWRAAEDAVHDAGGL